MTTISWPVRDQPLTHELWREGMSGTDGILDDTTGLAFALTLPSTGDLGTVESGGKYRLRGYVLQVTADQTVSLPAVSSGSPKVYDVGIKYDPAAEAAAAGPLSIFAAQTGTYSPAGGTAYVTLWKVTRSVGQVLSAAARSDYRTWSAATYYGAANAHALTWPVGSRLLLEGGLELVRVPTISGGAVVGTQWRSASDPAWAALSLTSGMAAFDTAPQYARLGGEVILRGSVKRTSGAQLAAANATVTLGTLPVGFRPGQTYQYPAAVSYANGNHSGKLAVGTDGTVKFTPSLDDLPWCTLDNVRFHLPTPAVTFVS